jgi:tight adherence protein B
MQSNALILAGLTMIAVGGLLYAFVYPYFSGEAQAEKRQAAIKSSGNKRASDSARDASLRRRQIADSLKEIEARGKGKRLTLEAKIGQAGLTWSKSNFFVFSGIMAVVVALLLLYITGNILYVVPGLAIGGFGLPNWFLSFQKKRRIAKFINEFPNAIDVIIRGIKAGLPLGDCLRIIASEAEEPVKSEFRSVARIVERVPVTEANFFSIVINIQQNSGGNLSEALGNLSRVLRDRKKMKQKIQAMSGEAKASAGIIGCLPFVVTILVYVSSPHYIELLWTTPTGKMVMAVSGFWMFLGILTMRKMISFDI